MSISHIIEQPEQGGATKVSFSGTLHTVNPGGEGTYAALLAEPQLPLRGKNRFSFALRGAGAAVGGRAVQKFLGHCTRGLCLSGCEDTNETLNGC